MVRSDGFVLGLFNSPSLLFLERQILIMASKNRKLKKVYMPKWVMWFVIVMMVPMFALIEYEAFFGKETNPAVGIAVGFMLLMVIVMMLLMGYRKLPYFLIEE